MTATGDQLALSLEGFRNNGLFSDHFLTDVFVEWEEFATAEIDPLRSELLELWRFERDGLVRANEAQTEERWIKPVLERLGFHYTVQAGVSFGDGRRQPDYALFLTDDARRDADGLEGGSRYERAACVADAKRFDRPLDRRSSVGQYSEDPVAQIINYVLITRCPFGLLTNGRQWRLYAAAEGLTDGAFLEVDLPALLESEDPEGFRWFVALFRAASFADAEPGGSLLSRALRESTAGAVAVSNALELQIHEALPLIATGLIGGDEPSEQARAEALEGSLVLLFRLLFCLYAEARGLLPIENEHYRDYSLRKQKEELAADLRRGRRFASVSTDIYNDLTALFAIVDKGDDAIGVPEYNGGLFAASRHPYFVGRSVPDALLAPALDRIYRVRGEFVDYRDLSVRQLGTTYERLLDFKLVAGEDGLTLEPSDGRRETGSYFTPALVVDRIVERTLGPILAARSEQAATAGLAGEKALDVLLDLRVLDPAMGSGHFLVAAARWIAQSAATDPSYGGALDRDQITRRVAERCIYGVDLFPMAVELARLSLWLATAREGEPLTFLSNLREGNSLVGLEVEDLLAGQDDLFAERFATELGEMIDGAERIGATESRDADGVHEKERLAEAVEDLREPMERMADELTAEAWTGDTAPLAFHWPLEFPEVFLDGSGRPRVDGGFDAVIGNPPYVRIQALGRELATWCRAHYETASGAFDTYVPFIERGLTLLGPKGRLSFIVPNKLTKLDFASKLRELLTERRVMEEITDFADAQLFPGATNYTCILALDRSGQDDLVFRKVATGAEALEDALTDLDRAPAERYPLAGLGADPWVLATGEEARLIDSMRRGAATLGEVTQQIFQGLITSADPVYIVQDRGNRAGRRVVYSKASERELELEPDLLKPLASGGDVERYAFRPLSDLLLFPYVREDGAMRLLTEDELDALPLTAAYLREHESSLRGREHGRMDTPSWYAFGRTQSLGLHDQPKLGVAATVRRLEVALDSEGGTYFHNVRVNGILAADGGISLLSLVTLLNSQLLDWMFKRLSVPLANGFFAANKQFISPLPIRQPGAHAAGLERLGDRAHELAASVLAERGGFARWLETTLGASLGNVAGSTRIARYEDLATGELTDLLIGNRGTAERARTRGFQEELVSEHASSADRVRGFSTDLLAIEREIDDLVFDMYELSTVQRELVDAEYAPAE